MPTSTTLKKLLEDEDTDKDAFTAAITKLGESSQKMGAAMYAASEAEARGARPASRGAADRRRRRRRRRRRDRGRGRPGSADDGETK